MRKLILALCLFVGALGVQLGASAADAAPVAADPRLEARVQKLSEELRCLVCQNQNLADSHAELAVDLKNQVREQLAAGRSEKDVIDYMVQRYGDFVLYRPPLKLTTLLLWGGPFVLFVAALAVLFLKLRRRSNNALPPLSAAERTAASRLLDGKENV